MMIAIIIAASLGILAVVFLIVFVISVKILNLIVKKTFEEEHKNDRNQM